MTERLRIGLIGFGRMGRQVAEVAGERGHEIVWNCTDSIQDRDASDVDVLIDFSTADAVAENVRAAIRSRRPLILGTTGWDRDGTVRATLQHEVSAAHATVLEAPNLALGMARFRRIVELAAQLFAADEDADLWLEERHHAAKRDRPSGTALSLAQSVREHMPRAREHLEITSARGGWVPGEHRICIDTPEETIELVHRARSRRVFAHGAVRAAERLIGRRGWLTLEDLERHDDVMAPVGAQGGTEDDQN